MPTSLAIAVRIAASSVRSIARRDGQPLRRGRGGRPPGPSRRSPSRRCRRRAACRRRRSSRAAPAAAASSASRFSLERLLAQLADLRGLHQHRARGRRRRTASRSVSRLGQERIEEARRAGVVDRAAPRGPRAARGGRRTRGPAPRARGRASRPAPGARTGRRPAARTPTRRRPAPKAIVRQPRSRASASAARVSGVDSSAPKAIDDVVRLGDRLDLRGRAAPPSRGEPDRRQRALADDHRVDELDRDVARVRARRRRAADRDQPAAAREALGHPVAAAREPLRLALEEAPRPRSSRALEQLVDAGGEAPSSPRAVIGRLGRARRARATAGEPLAPLVDALAGAGADQHHRTPGLTASMLASSRSRSKSRCGSRSILLTSDQLAGAEHERVLERLVLALGDRGDHHPGVLADPELGRADEVADVLDHQQVDLVQRQRRRSPSGPCSRRGGTRRRTPDRC